MLARIRKAQEKDSGFTLIELLVVMIIIGILAAIAIPAFLSQKNKAKETSAKSDVSTIGKEIAAYFVDGAGPLTMAGSAGAWSGSTASPVTVVVSGKLSAGNAVQTGTDNVVTSAAAWCVAVKNTDAPTIWKYSSKNGLDKGNCASADITP